MTTARHHRATRVVPESVPAGSFLEGLAAQDFARLGGAVTEDACLRALLPAGLREWAGLRLAVDRDALAWAHGDGLVLRGLVSLPVVLGLRRG